MPGTGSGTSEIMPFAIATGSNTQLPADWQAADVRQQGFQVGIADPTEVNTVLRQASFITTVLGQFMADWSQQTTADDGDLVDAENNLIAALRALLQPLGVSFIEDIGTANEMIGTSEPIPDAYSSPGFIVVKKMAEANTGIMTVDFWDKGAVALNDNTGAALSPSALLGGAFYIMAYDGAAYRVLGGTASYTNVTDLTANSGDMIQVTGGGLVNFRTLAGTHNTTVSSGDKWPRGKASDDTALYMTTTEFQSWISTVFPVPSLSIFTSNGTFTPSANKRAALIFATGGGASGGGGVQGYNGQGGGAGGTAISMISLIGLSPQPITIGDGGDPANGGERGRPGGDTLVGGILKATGGEGGQIGAATGYGDGGIGTIGNLLLRGSPGTPRSGGDQAGNGGGSFWGGGGSYGSDAGQRRLAQPGYMGGGGGGGANTAGWRVSGAGGPGVVVVIQF